LDDQSVYGVAHTLRGGYVATHAGWTGKVLYGESYREPPPRVLYGGWAGSGSDPDLQPEEARTWELSLQREALGQRYLLSLYRVDAAHTIRNFAGGAQNMGHQRAEGLDLHWLGGVESKTGIQWWAYYSFLQTDQDDPAQVDQDQPIGDSARHKFHAGMTYHWAERFQMTLRGRYIGSKHTIASNPLDKIPAYRTLDATWRYATRQLELAVSIFNVLDHGYVHPGVRNANAGDVPGFWDEQGVWQGSAGFFNSALPQEGRQIYLTGSFVF
jgi:outer membrane cobalamin receptor